MPADDDEEENLAEFADDFCAYCGCQEYAACRLAGATPCSWYRQVDTARGRFSVCSNPECVQQYLADASAP